MTAWCTRYLSLSKCAKVQSKKQIIDIKKKTMRIKKLLCAMMLMASAAMAAQESNVPEFCTWAPTAPKGWNSWDCYYSTVNEKLVLQNAKYMKDNLLEYGWEYVVIDIRWYANHPSLGGGWYNQEKTPECQLDELS